MRFSYSLCSIWSIGIALSGCIDIPESSDLSSSSNSGIVGGTSLATISGTVVDENAQPLANITVSVKSQLTSWMKSTQTNAQGHFAFHSGINPNEVYQIRFAHKLYHSFTSERKIHAGENRISTTLISISDDSNATCTDGIQNQGELDIDCGGPCTTCISPEATCSDGIRNQGEQAIDCGGPCEACPTAPDPTCNDGVQNQNEEDIDCGGPCNACPSCADGIRNQGEQAIDCGGPCEACPTAPDPTCNDGIRNQGEQAIDCGGPCSACPSCADGIRNQGEQAIDCGGPCEACPTAPDPTCNDGIRNQGEQAIDCGGPCSACPSCTDGIQNQNEEDIDCGGSCGACPSCTDGILNQNEEDTDCGGPCNACPNCTDGIRNQNEEGIDCGGVCTNTCPAANCGDNSALSMVSINQGVHVPIFDDQGVVGASDRNAHIIQQRRALLRVFVQDVNNTQQATLFWNLGDGSESRAVSGQRQALGASRLLDIDSTINFDVPAEWLTSQASWAVRLNSSASCSLESNHMTQLNPIEVGSFKVVLVPIRYNADGSERLPTLDEDMLRALREELLKIMPVSGVDLSVRPEPFDWGSAVTADGRESWSNLLNEILSLRQSEVSDPTIFYYGIFMPTNSSRSFCQNRCIAGMGTRPSNARNTYARASIGLGYSPRAAAGTFAHELGHNAGLPHAPCGNVASADSDYPYAEGKIGVPGFDIVRSDNISRLIDPNERYDLMSYCSPTWISDHNFNKVASRMREVNRQNKYIRSIEPKTWRILMQSNNVLSWGRSLVLRENPSGPTVSISYITEAGQVITTKDGVELEVDHAEPFILVPTAPPNAHSISLPDNQSIAL